MQTALWPLVLHQSVLSLLSYERLSKKPILFKSFTAGLTIKEFDYIYNKEIAKKYEKHEIKRLSNRKNRKRSTGAGRHFKLDLKDRFVILLVYYRLYITFTLAGFLFDLDQKSNICRDIQNIDSLVRQCVPIPQKIYNIKEAKNSRGSRAIFSRPYGFYRFHRTTDTKTCCR